MAERLHGTLADGARCVLELSPERSFIEIERSGLDALPVLRNDGRVPDRCVVKLRNGSQAVLLHCYRMGHRGHLLGEPFMLQRVGANIIIVGPREFPEDQLISSIRFRPSNDLVAIFSRDHRRLARVPESFAFEVTTLLSGPAEYGPVLVDVLDARRHTFANIETSVFSVELSMSVQESHGQLGGEIREEHVVRVSYREPTPIEDGLTIARLICYFFTFMVGLSIRGHDYKIAVPGTSDPQPLPYDLHIRGRQEGSNSILPSQALLSLQMDGGVYAEALNRWLTRRNEWQHSYTYMAVAGGYDELGQIGRERLLNASSWMESLPDEALALRTKVSKRLVATAAKRASAILEQSDLARMELSKVKNALATMYVPGFADRLRAAVQRLRSVWPTCLPIDVEGLVKRATSMRNMYAHGGFAESRYSVDEIYVSTVFLEYVCSLLMLVGLGWSFERIRSAHNHPLVNAHNTIVEFCRTEPT